MTFLNFFIPSLAHEGVILYINLLDYEEEGMGVPKMDDIVDHLTEECSLLTKPGVNGAAAAKEPLSHRCAKLEEISWPKSIEDPKQGVAHVGICEHGSFAFIPK